MTKPQTEENKQQQIKQQNWKKFSMVMFLLYVSMLEIVSCKKGKFEYPTKNLELNKIKASLDLSILFLVSDRNKYNAISQISLFRILP